MGFRLSVMPLLSVAADLHGATPHVLRHTYLTTAAGENIDSKTLQSMAGHANHQMRMNIYVHAKKENVARARQTMDELLGNYATKKRGMDAFGRTPYLSFFQLLLGK